MGTHKNWYEKYKEYYEIGNNEDSFGFLWWSDQDLSVKTKPFSNGYRDAHDIITQKTVAAGRVDRRKKQISFNPSPMGGPMSDRTSLQVIYEQLKERFPGFEIFVSQIF